MEMRDVHTGKQAGILLKCSAVWLPGWSSPLSLVDHLPCMLADHNLRVLAAVAPTRVITRSQPCLMLLS